MNDGFTTKAIAIYKKVAKLAPEESRPLERLAELYVQQGVLSEARPLFLQLAEMHLKAGRQPQAALLLKKLLEAEPENLRVQLRLAELQLSMGWPRKPLPGLLQHHAASSGTWATIRKPFVWPTGSCNWTPRIIQPSC